MISNPGNHYVSFTLLSLVNIMEATICVPYMSHVGPSRSIGPSRYGAYVPSSSSSSFNKTKLTHSCHFQRVLLLSALRVYRPCGCGKLDPPSNGKVDYASYDVDNVATYSCNDGLVLSFTATTFLYIFLLL